MIKARAVNNRIAFLATMFNENLTVILDAV
jgi:hypothetical protein